MPVQCRQTGFHGNSSVWKQNRPNKRTSQSPARNEGAGTVSEVRSFLGLANYSSRFIPHFATLTEPLRKLTRKDVPFHFGPEQKASFESLKQSMTEAGTLAYFNKSASTKVVADATPIVWRTTNKQTTNKQLYSLLYIYVSINIGKN